MNLFYIYSPLIRDLTIERPQEGFRYLWIKLIIWMNMIILGSVGSIGEVSLPTN